MLSLNDRKWKKFEIGSLFQINRGNAKNVINKASGKTALVTAIDSKNGLSACVIAENGEKKYKEVYTVNNNGNGVCLAYWHEYSFICSSDVTVLTPKFRQLRNRNIAQFIVTTIRNQKAKYNYGYKMSNERTNKQKIMLPITPDGQPDYAFMEQYIKEREEKLTQKYLDYIGNNWKAGGELPALEEKEWRNFKVVDLFDYRRGNQNNMTSLIEGDSLLISAKNVNNGVKGFYTSNNEKKGLYSGNCVTLNNDGDGGVGLAYYQPYKFLLDTHVYALYPKENISAFSMLYLSQSLSKQRTCFSHGYSISQERLNAMRIMLPVTPDGKPDYAYMEQYAKNIMYSKYKAYIGYVRK